MPAAEIGAKGWANKIIALLPDGEVVAPETELSKAEIDALGLRDLRYALQDLKFFRITAERDYLVNAYQARAEEGGSERDIQLAKLYGLTKVDGKIADLSSLDPYIASSDWFVVISAMLEKTASQIYYDPRLASETLNQLILNLPAEGEGVWLEEAQYNVSAMAQALSTTLGNLEETYKNSLVTIRLGANQDRLLDRHTIVFNLIQVHSDKFSYDQTPRISDALVRYSRNLSDRKLYQALILHGRILDRAERSQVAIDPLKEALALEDSLSGRGQSTQEREYWPTMLRYTLAGVHAELGQVGKAEEMFAETLKLQSTNSRPYINQASLDLVEAKILRGRGDYEGAAKLFERSAKALRLQSVRRRLNNQSNLDMNIAFDSEASDSLLSRARRAPVLDLQKFIAADDNNSANPQALSPIAERRYKELVNEIGLQSLRPPKYENSAAGQRQRFMDALFERVSARPSDVLSDYRQAADPESEKDMMFLRLFETTLRDIGRISAATARETGKNDLDDLDNLLRRYEGLDKVEVSTYAYVLRAAAALKNANAELAWQALARAERILPNLFPIPADLQFEVTELQLLLFALEGNPEEALLAAKLHMQSGEEAGRISTGVSALNNTIIALERAGYYDTALSLSDEFVEFTRLDPEGISFHALYAKGRLLNQFGEFGDAERFLSEAITDFPDVADGPLIQRQLYLAQAGAKKIGPAKLLRRDLILALNRLNSPELTDTTAPILARGDYLLGVLENSEDVPALLTRWQELEIASAMAQSQYGQALSRYRAAGRAEASEIQAERLLVQTDEIQKTLNNERLLSLLALLFGLGSLGGLGYILYRSRRVQRNNEKYLRASQVKGQFLNLIGHEARVSLQGIDSFVQSLKASSVSMEHLPTVQVIGSQAASLRQAISDFIFSARIISGDRPVNDQLFTPLEYRSRMVPVWEDAIGGRDVTVSFDVSPKLPVFLVDTFFLETAMSQLMKVAIDKTRIGAIDISFTPENSLRGMRLNVSIEDTGSGIPDGELDSLFNFFEVDENGISKSGHAQNLGFPIAKNAIEALGGVMQVKSKLGQGTRVSFSVPVKRAAANDLDDEVDDE